MLDTINNQPYSTVRKKIIEELDRLGYSEGKNLTIKYYSLDNYVGKGINIWKHLEKSKNHDVVFLNGTTATKAFLEIAKKNSNKFVFANVTDPIALKAIDDFITKPTKNMTGISYSLPLEDRLRFVRKLIPHVRKIGLIYSDQLSSSYYNKKLKKILLKEEFREIKVIFRKVPFVQGINGHKRMSLLAKRHILELSPIVDVFLSPHDNMGGTEEFSQVMYKYSTKPLIGVARNDVLEGWGATASIFPLLEKTGAMAAQIIFKLFNGAQVKDIIPLRPVEGIGLDLKKIKEFGIDVPIEILEKSEKY